MSVLAYWNNLLVLLKMMRAISQSHRTLSSYAFFIRPNFRLVNVTWRGRERGRGREGEEERERKREGEEREAERGERERERGLELSHINI